MKTLRSTRSVVLNTASPTRCVKLRYLCERTGWIDADAYVRPSHDARALALLFRRRSSSSSSRARQRRSVHAPVPSRPPPERRRPSIDEHFVQSQTLHELPSTLAFTISINRTVRAFRPRVSGLASARSDPASPPTVVRATSKLAHPPQTPHAHVDHRLHLQREEFQSRNGERKPSSCVSSPVHDPTLAIVAPIGSGTSTY